MSLAEATHEQKFEAAVAHPDYVYSRFRNGCVWVYHSDASSPTGVLMRCGHHQVEWAEGVIRRIRDNSPLSPTEGLKSSGARLY